MNPARRLPLEHRSDKILLLGAQRAFGKIVRLSVAVSAASSKSTNRRSAPAWLERCFTFADRPNQLGAVGSIFTRPERARSASKRALTGRTHAEPRLYLTPLAPGAYSERVEFGSPGGTAHAALSFAPQILALSVLALGCKTGKSFDRTTEPGGRPLSRTTTGSLIIKGRAFGTNNPRRLCRWDANL